MLKFRSILSLKSTTNLGLQNLQDQINNEINFASKVAKAKTLFANKKNTRAGKEIFEDIISCLTEMCYGACRCSYCEDSVADEIEHVKPKNFYPELTFVWNNYVFACGNCNGPKNNKYAIIDSETQTIIKINTLSNRKHEPPPVGVDAIINPRISDSMDFVYLDIGQTFQFITRKDINEVDKIRAEYTFNEVLRLNQREHLRVARENAYNNYKARLAFYNLAKKDGEAQDLLDNMIDGILNEAHPSVWKEIQRQFKNGNLKNIDKMFYELFVKNQEAINW